MDIVNKARAIREHYGLARPVTADEMFAEIENLQRKADAGVLDDRAGLLAAKLSIVPRD